MNPEDLKKAPKWFQRWYDNDFKHLDKRVNRLEWIAWGILFGLIAIELANRIWG